MDLIISIVAIVVGVYFVLLIVRVEDHLRSISDSLNEVAGSFKELNHELGEIKTEIEDIKINQERYGGRS